MATPPSYTLACSYDGLLLLAQALERWIAESRDTHRVLGASHDPERLRDLVSQIEHAQALLARVNEARR